MPKILLFIPMYNCEKQIVRVLNQLTNPDIIFYISEVLVVNNRSTDNGEEAVINYCKEHTLPPLKLLRNEQNYGLGGSHKVAFNYAIENHFDYVIVLHGDDQGNIQDILPLLKSREFENYDCCLGARFMKGAKLYGYSKFRTFGNIVYNLIFSVCLGHRLYDLGAGINLYSVNMLKNGFYLKYKDNLVFNYCMTLGQAYYKYRTKFIPISWREEDQVSNVKMMNQAVTVLKLLFSYMKNKKQFIDAEHRDKIFESYAAKVIYSKL